MPRGRLINRMVAGFLLEDPAATTFNHDYSEPVGPRAETPVIEIPCQVEEPTWYISQFSAGGLEGEGSLSLVLHFSDIELRGLLSPEGHCTINVGARLSYIRREAGPVVESYPTPLYVIDVQSSSWGLSVDNDPTRNLLFLLIGERLND